MNTMQSMSMQQNSMPMQQPSAQLEEQDILYTVLCDLKRTAREYTTAATESNCSVVRQVFHQLLNSTLNMQEHVYQLMKQHQMYNTSSPALRQELDKQLQHYRQTEQQTMQLLQNKLQLGGSGARGFQGTGMGMQQQPSPGQSIYGQVQLPMQPIMPNYPPSASLSQGQGQRAGAPSHIYM
ncbi:spore coat protein [Paenibacillus sp. y28]|uniref:spore coat protein n=1 Tax=Paenibacillus sp. y28 TaxID=3129110 RepID=UPI00301A3D9E